MNTMSIMRMRETIKTIARPSTFYVTITGNPKTQSISSELFKFTCMSASLPGVTTGKVEVPYMSRKIPYLGDRVYEDWNTEIILNKDLTIYKEILNWHNTWNHASENVASELELTSYLCDANVHVLDPMNNSVIDVKMVGIFPYQIANLELNWESTDQFIRWPVTWFITYFEIVGVTDQITTTIQRPTDNVYTA